MLYFSIFLVFYSILLSLAKADKSIPVYKIDLDAPPEARWNEVAVDFKKHAKSLLKMSEKFLPLPLLKLAWILAEKLDNLPDEYSKEIKGMSKASGIPVGELIVFAVFYDVFSYGHSDTGYGKDCTGIVARDSKGRLFHGRNFDYLYGDTLKNMTIIADFQRKNKTIFSVTTFAFFTGIFTGQKPGVFTISINQRDSGTAFENLLMALYTKFKAPMGIVVRQVLEYANSYDHAVEYLSSIPLVAPVYFIVAGKKATEGCVITRDRLKPANLWTLAQSKSWYIVETNYDHWKPVPSFDERRELTSLVRARKEISDGRAMATVRFGLRSHSPAIRNFLPGSYERSDLSRIAAKHALDKLGQNRLNSDSLFDVLSIFPVKNNLTIFTTIMSAEKPELYYNSKIRT